MSVKLIAPVLLLYVIPVPPLKAPLDLALVKYKLVEPSLKSSESLALNHASTLASALAFV